MGITVRYLFDFKYKYIFCKGDFRRLLPIRLKNDIAINFIGEYRYALCPRCHLTDRERLVYWHITKMSNILN